MIRSLSKREKIILYIAFGVAGFGIIFKVFIAPVLDRNDNLNKEISASRAKLNKYIQLLSRKNYYQAKFGKFTTGLKPASEKGTGSVAALSALEELAMASGVHIIDMRPQTARKQNLYQEIPIDIRIEGNIEGLARFIYSVEDPLSLFRIKKLQISARLNSPALEGNFSLIRFSTD